MSTYDEASETAPKTDTLETSLAALTCPTSVSYATDIKPLFTPGDVECMSGSFNLDSYDDVKTYAKAIYRKLAAHQMPPGAPWTDAQINLFGCWIQLGYAP